MYTLTNHLMAMYCQRIRLGFKPGGLVALLPGQPIEIQNEGKMIVAQNACPIIPAQSFVASTAVL